MTVKEAILSCCSYISIDQLVMGGKPCISMTRFPVSQLLAEILEQESGKQALREVVEDFDLHYDDCLSALKNMAEFFDQYWE